MKSSSVSHKPSFPTHDIPVNGTYPGDPQPGKIKSPPFNLERFKETAQKAKETFVGKELDEQLSDTLRQFEDLMLKDFHNKINWKTDWNTLYMTILDLVKPLLSQAEQRGYERGKVK